MRRFFHDNGLSIAVFGLFLFSLAGQYVTGWHEFNDEQRLRGRIEVSFAGYVGEGHFVEAVFENWESEFLQMGAYVLLTVWLYQKGSSQSKTPDAVDRVDLIPERSRTDPDAPSAVRAGGWRLKLYENSLSLALFALFLFSFVLHAYGGAEVYNQEQAEHGAPRISMIGYMATSQFWFESFQNWQSEFFSIGMMVVLTIFLRQKGSPQSKPVDSPHDETDG